jgi:SanA protein
MNKKKIILIFFSLLLITCLVFVLVANRLITQAAEGKLYNDADAIPFNKTGLLLGTGKFLSDGRVNLYYQYRIDAALSLIRKQKIKYLIISGDNSRVDYNEPQTMKNDLVNAGVDSSVIFLDYAGFRTFDSIVRLGEIFSQDSVTIISQPFHNERAVYLASKKGIAAIGFNARDVAANAGIKVKLREKLARVKVFIDGWLNQKPKFGGEKINLPG